MPASTSAPEPSKKRRLNLPNLDELEFRIVAALPKDSRIDCAQSTLAWMREVRSEAAPEA